MTVSELITELEAYPMDARLVVSGFEQGYDDLGAVTQIAIVPAADPAWWTGRYDAAPPEKLAQAEQVVLLFGDNDYIDKCR